MNVFPGDYANIIRIPKNRRTGPLIGGPAPFSASVSPLPILTPILWLRTTIGVGHTGSDVTSWTDPIGGNIFTTDSSSAGDPVLGASVLNGYPSIRFYVPSTVSNILISTSTFTVNQPFSIAWVARMTGSGDSGHVFLNFPFELDIFSSGGVGLLTNISGGSTTGPNPDTSWHYWVMIYNGASSFGLRDGMPYVSTWNANGGNIPSGTVLIGSGLESVTGGFELEETIVWNVALTNPQIATVNAYLKGKYAL